MVVYREGRADRDFESGVERALEALLAMPNFLFRLERQPVDTRAGDVYDLSDLELASRLSFFLWKSIPDDELIDVAAAGDLSDPETLAAQVRRMLADPRAVRFMNDFVGQWLQVRNIHSQDPDGALFAGFNDSLRNAMVQETELFFESQVRADRPIPELLVADYTFLNEDLARHYGIDDIYGSRFRRVQWEDDRRHGLLGHASLLTVTSYANRTSVVLRGLWVLENLLGAPPPPPPPNVPPLAENDRANPTSLRERMEQHRASPVCASCHRRMDPLGFAMENFDAIGRWRETDGGAEINSTITLSGKTIDSPRVAARGAAGRGPQRVHPDRHREAADLRARARRRLLRRADDSPDRARHRGRRLSVVGARAGGRGEPAVPDAAGAADRRAGREPAVSRRRPTWKPVLKRKT